MLARPEQQGRSSNASDLLAALGAREDIRSSARGRLDDDAHAVIWLAAHRTRTVVCASPQPLKTATLEHLAGLCAAAGNDLRLACDTGHARRTTDRLGAVGATSVGWDDAVAALPPAAPHPAEPDPPDPAEWDGRTALPRTDFTAFRDDCRRLLPPDQHAAVDALYAATARRVRDDPADPGEVAVYSSLGRDLDACATLDEALTVLRATQAGLFARGWLLTADTDKTISGLCDEDRPLPLTPAQWRSLRAYRLPARAAACALNAAGLSTAQIEHAHVVDAADDGPIADASPHAMPYLRAQRLLRLSEGAALEDRLIDMPLASITAALRDARRDLGLRLAARVAADDAARSSRWRVSLGLRLLDIR